MKGTLDDYINYRLERAKATFNDAKLLAANHSWNSCINRLYYSCYYAVSALLIKKGIKTKTHNGVRIQFFKTFVKTGIINKDFGKLYSDLFEWRQEGDYSDFILFDEETVLPLIKGTEEFFAEIKKNL